MPRRTRRSSKHRRGASRRSAGGFWPFNSFFGPNTVGPTGRPSTTGTFTETSYGIPGILGSRTITNAQGKVMTQKTGIPAALNMLQFATKAHPNGLLGLKGQQPTEASTGAPYPPYPAILGINLTGADFTPEKLQAAYNAKKNIGTNADKKLVKNAFNTFSDPEKRATYLKTMGDWYAKHPLTLANAIAMGAKGPGGVNLSANPFL